MSDEMKFKEEELESMADKLLEQASIAELSEQPELELPKPKKRPPPRKKRDCRPRRGRQDRGRAPQ